jgi:hypothetical protein
VRKLPHLPGNPSERAPPRTPGACPSACLRRHVEKVELRPHRVRRLARLRAVRLPQNIEQAHPQPPRLALVYTPRARLCAFLLRRPQACLPSAPAAGCTKM